MAKSPGGMASGAAEGSRSMARVSLGAPRSGLHSSDTAAIATPGTRHLRLDMGSARPRGRTGDSDVAARPLIVDHDGRGVRLESVPSAAVGRRHRSPPDLSGGDMAAT